MIYNGATRVYHNDIMYVQGFRVDKLYITGILAYEYSPNNKKLVQADFKTLNNISILDGVWLPSFNKIVAYRSNSSEGFTRRIQADFDNLSNVIIHNGRWNQDKQTISSDDLLHFNKVRIIFDNLNNIVLHSGVWNESEHKIMSIETKAIVINFKSVDNIIIHNGIWNEEGVIYA